MSGGWQFELSLMTKDPKDPSVKPKSAQTAIEYLVLLGLVTAVVFAGSNALLSRSQKGGEEYYMLYSLIESKSLKLYFRHALFSFLAIIMVMIASFSYIYCCIYSKSDKPK